MNSPAPSDARLVELTSFQPAEPPRTTDEPARRFTRLITVPGEPTREGATSSVRKVVNAAGEMFALKVLAAPRGDDTPGRMGILLRARESAFLEEYRNHLAVSHLQGFPRLYGHGRVGGRAAILMEWVEGPSLRSVIKAKGTPWRAQAVAAFGRDVLKVLIQASTLEEGFVHRDLSTRNILLRTTRRSVERQLAECSFDVCLVDMGSSAILDVQSCTYTMMADVWRNGTPDYAPPEMLTRDVAGIDELRHSPAIDVYALCSILYELYSGRTPYDTLEHPERSAYRLKMDTSPEPLVARVARDASLCEIVMAGIARAASQRPIQSCLREALCFWLAGEERPEARLMAHSKWRPRGERGPLPGGSRMTRGLAALSWDDIAGVSGELAAARDDTAAMSVARRYGICGENNLLDRSQVKQVRVGDTFLDVQVAGIRHDVRPDGSLVGLTFLLTEMMPDERPMSREPMTEGAWERSDLRAWLNGEVMSLLPDDLARNITVAAKRTNNVGGTKDARATSVTKDALWLLAYAEISGARKRTEFSEGYHYLAGILNSEGHQYKLFSDQGVLYQGDYSAVIRLRAGQPAYWWLRSASPDVSLSEGQTYFNRTAPNGDPFHFATVATEPSGVLFGFCV